MWKLTQCLYQPMDRVTRGFGANHSRSFAPRTSRECNERPHCGTQDITTLGRRPWREPPQLSKLLSRSALTKWGKIVSDCEAQEVPGCRRAEATYAYHWWETLILSLKPGAITPNIVVNEWVSLKGQPEFRNALDENGLVQSIPIASENHARESWKLGWREGFKYKTSDHRTINGLST